MNKITVGSVCSGIEAASVAWHGRGFEFEWFSEIAAFPSKLLHLKYPHIPNLGDLCDLPRQLQRGDIATPDLICGGTPCQAFSLAGWKKGLEDVRGNLTLKFVDILNANDARRQAQRLPPTLVFWENVEGVLRDNTNAFGCFLASLAGLDEEIKIRGKWPSAGVLQGPQRRIAWRVLDARHFGLAQQRRRLYLMAGGPAFAPEDILFETNPPRSPASLHHQPLVFEKDGHAIEVFRAYTDCLYSAYGTKWNGNAAAYNGSLFVSQNHRLRRFSPLECERLMGFPDNYTQIEGAKTTSRYQAVGNSWAVPVVQWLGERIAAHQQTPPPAPLLPLLPESARIELSPQLHLWNLSPATPVLQDGRSLNTSPTPCHPLMGDIRDVIDVNAEEKFYLTPVGCKGILRRKAERQLSMNPRLECVLHDIAATWSDEAIERISRRQSRGRFSQPSAIPTSAVTPTNETLPLWEE